MSTTLMIAETTAITRSYISIHHTRSTNQAARSLVEAARRAPRARRPFWWASHSRSAAAGSAVRATGARRVVCASRSYCAAHRLGRIATTWSDSIHVMPASNTQGAESEEDRRHTDLRAFDHRLGHVS